MCCALAPLRQKYDSFSFPFPSSATRTTRPTTCARASGRQRAQPILPPEALTVDDKRGCAEDPPLERLGNKLRVQRLRLGSVSAACSSTCSFAHRIHSHSQWRCAPQDRSCRALRPTARAVAHAKAGTRPHHAPVPRSPSSLGTCSNSGPLAALGQNSACLRWDTRCAENQPANALWTKQLSEQALVQWAGARFRGSPR